MTPYCREVQLHRRFADCYTALNLFPAFRPFVQHGNHQKKSNWDDSGQVTRRIARCRGHKVVDLNLSYYPLEISIEGRPNKL
jgi:hypothetical protein